MKPPSPAPKTVVTKRVDTGAQLLLAYLYALTITPFILARFFFDIALCIHPSTRPTQEWALMQAVRMRIAKLVLLYVSLLRAGTSISLRSGKERSRFELLMPQEPGLYKGPLSDEEIAPEPIGMTWTPTRPQGVLDSDAAVVLHFHGGAFVLGDGRDADTGYLARTLIRQMGCSHVCSPQYRLSCTPEGRFPAALQDALTSYLHIIREKRISPKQIILSGDSAGGNLALGLLRYIHEYGKDLQIPAPAAVALWSPWVDVGAALHKDLSESPHYHTDYLNREFGRWGAACITGYGKVDPEGPYLSPLHYPFKMEEDVPIFVQAGEREVICDDVKALARDFKKAGWKTVKLHMTECAPHDIMLIGPMIGFSKQAKEAAREAGVFLRMVTELGLRC